MQKSMSRAERETGIFASLVASFQGSPKQMWKLRDFAYDLAISYNHCKSMSMG